MLEYQAAKDLLNNKTILVTGAGDGIGRAASIEFAKHGATVILLGKTVKKLENVYDEIVNAGYPKPAIVPLDMKGATEQNYIDMADTIAEQFGHLDGLLHNASQLGALGPFEHIDLTSLETILKVNVTAQAIMTKSLLPIMRKAEHASIVFTSSGVGRKGRAYWGPYAFSKFATEGMMQVLADECDNTSVRVNSINPGATRTEMRAKAYPAEDPQTLKTAEQIMPTYLFLMGNESIDTNGQALNAQ
ncbi:MULTISPECIES: YciK family oxidoreductase [Shewanella]|jgi:NAD(P)-dependent dehydrogenase (short-subunit alcohol dehydrogenase family)|uniref:Short-chain dehydrogenase/reductase SDR n=1 Tax=Shewanella frigidimarina (strain NCIMB 400) TaxID=318167 RepID=Q080A2_SHEFN|nr:MULTISPECIES: YciK family oxidoreductase [Shewanella]ABI72413.1 short-chain dehydrogenase/reductase SDR [Shewanella frigidimarina NCIMB 400]MBB1361622.1 YciK family oxidoreductase [Shewanella sp. SR44-4]MBO1896815.1 YciK family oxidoreductase [Shewanella sp. BF02_Schw]PKH29306.1 YciK family oxidoreductase [Shewanella sp. ALD9]QHS12921.1 YciK family oxidoreductase [Shewanella sp. Arc9-LZ]|tara:strand:+ start:547 stop:1284 length:738 start_codon:yes stop_codon:yes gene_type:complete